MTILAIYLVRHGETDANRQGIVQGQLDTELNELGQRQARLVAERLRSVAFDTSFSSDLSRAVKTAEAILSHHQDIALLKQIEIRERFMGDLQGRQPGGATSTQRASDRETPHHAIDATGHKRGKKKEKMGDLQSRQATPIHKYTTGDTVESVERFINRITNWWDSFLKHAIALPPKPDGGPYRILVVSHGGVIGTLVRSLIRRRKLSCARGVFVLGCPNTSVSIIEVGEDGKGVITAYGDDSHLEGMSELENVDEIGLRN